MISCSLRNPHHSWKWLPLDAALCPRLWSIGIRMLLLYLCNNAPEMTAVHSSEASGWLQKIIHSILILYHVRSLLAVLMKWCCWNDPLGIAHYLVKEQPLKVRKMDTSNVSKRHLDIQTLIQVRLDLGDGVLFPIERKEGDMEAIRSLQGTRKCANTVVVDVLWKCQVRIWPHVD